MAEGEDDFLTEAKRELINHYVSEYIFEIVKYLPKVAKKAYSLGSRQATETLGHDYDEEDYAANASSFAASYTKTMAEEGGSMIDGELVPWLDDLDEGLREDIANTIMEGYTKGWSHRELVDAMQGVWDESDIRIEMVARTELARAMYYGEIDRYEEEGVSQVEWLTGNMACDDCAAMNGQIFDIDKCPEIPYHPNCRCDIAPYTGEGGIRKTGFIKSKATHYHGGTGSGNWGHEGRPGLVGGSGEGGGIASDEKKSDDDRGDDKGGQRASTKAPDPRKVQAAIKGFHANDKNFRKIADANEQAFAKHIGGVWKGDNHPFDVETSEYGVEFKTFQKPKNSKVTIHGNERDIKLAYAEEKGLTPVLVIQDMRTDKWYMSYKIGSPRLTSPDIIETTPAELKRLLGEKRKGGKRK